MKYCACVLVLLLSSITALPSRAATPPSLRIWSANVPGTADLMPGRNVEVIIELRSDIAYTAFAQHLTPDGLTLEQATASSGAVVTTPFVSWTGVVSSTQPINIVISYRVKTDAQAGDRELKAQAEVAGQMLRAANVLRICCIPAPPAVGPPPRKTRLPVVRR
jgi:hypothetical protein